MFVVNWSQEIVMAGLLTAGDITLNTHTTPALTTSTHAGKLYIFYQVMFFVMYLHYIYCTLIYCIYCKHCMLNLCAADCVFPHLCLLVWKGKG